MLPTPLKRTPAWFVRSMLLLAVAIALAMVMSGRAFAQSIDGPVLVVASPALQGPYRGTVMHAVPFGAGHIGVILNRPSRVTLGELFPEHEPSKAVQDPVYFGGPISREALFGLLKASAQPSPRSIEMMPGIWLVPDGFAIDQAIETAPNDGRFFVGVVIWRSGELAEEIRRGAMVIRPADATKLFLKDTSQLHEQLAPKKGQVES